MVLIVYLACYLIMISATNAILLVMAWQVVCVAPQNGCVDQEDHSLGKIIILGY